MRTANREAAVSDEAKGDVMMMTATRGDAGGVGNDFDEAPSGDEMARLPANIGVEPNCPSAGVGLTVDEWVGLKAMLMEKARNGNLQAIRLILQLMRSPWVKPPPPDGADFAAVFGNFVKPSNGSIKPAAPPPSPPPSSDLPPPSPLPALAVPKKCGLPLEPPVVGCEQGGRWRLMAESRWQENRTANEKTAFIMSESAGHDPGKRGRTLDALSTISGVMLSPFRLPPAARPLGTAPKSLRGRSHGSTPAVTPSGRLFTGTTAGSGASSPKGTANSTSNATSAPPWARGDGIRAGVPGSAAGGPAPPPMPTELLMQSPTVGRATPTSDAKRQQLRKRHLVEIGTYLWRFGLYRGLWCAGLLAFAVVFPLIVAPPSGLELSGMQPPYFLSTWAGAYQWAVIVGIVVAVVAALALPMFLRGLVLAALGMAPFAAYVIAFNSGHAIAIPPELSGYTKLGYILFPAWVGMAAGMVVGQNFPEYMLGRAMAGGCAIIVLFYQVINPGVLVEAITTRTIAIEGLLGILVFALTLTAIGQFFAASMAVSFSFVKAGLVYVVGLPVIFAIFSHFGPAEERLADGSAYLGLHALLVVLAAFLMAVVGISELLHFFAFRSEVRAKLGHSFTRVKPTEPAFKQQFVIHCEKSGIYNSAEVDYLRTQLLL